MTTTTDTIDRNFGYLDRMGRLIGARVRIQDNLDPDRPFSFVPRATRDGKPYGAFVGAQYFFTAAERDAAIVKYFADAEKRAAKNHVSRPARWESD